MLFDQGAQSRRNRRAFVRIKINKDEYEFCGKPSDAFMFRNNGEIDGTVTDRIDCETTAKRFVKSARRFKFGRDLHQRRAAALFQGQLRKISPEFLPEPLLDDLVDHLEIARIKYDPGGIDIGEADCPLIDKRHCSRLSFDFTPFTEKLKRGGLRTYT